MEPNKSNISRRTLMKSLAAAGGMYPAFPGTAVADSSEPLQRTGTQAIADSDPNELDFSEFVSDLGDQFIDIIKENIIEFVIDQTHNLMEAYDLISDLISDAVDAASNSLAGAVEGLKWVFENKDDINDELEEELPDDDEGDDDDGDGSDGGSGETESISVDPNTVIAGGSTVDSATSATASSSWAHDDIYDAITDKIEDIEEGLNALGDWATDRIEDLYGAVGDLADLLAEGPRALIEYAVDKLVDVLWTPINVLFDTVEDSIDSVLNGSSSVPSIGLSPDDFPSVLPSELSLDFTGEVPDPSDVIEGESVGATTPAGAGLVGSSAGASAHRPPSSGSPPSLNLDKERLAAARSSPVGETNDSTTRISDYNPTVSDVDARRATVRNRAHRELFQPVSQGETLMQADGFDVGDNTDNPNNFNPNESNIDWESKNQQLQGQIDSAVNSAEGPFGFETQSQWGCGLYPGRVYFAGLSMNIDIPVAGTIDFTQWLGVSPGVPCLFIGQSADGEIKIEIDELYNLSKEHIADVVAAAEYSQEVIDEIIFSNVENLDSEEPITYTYNGAELELRELPYSELIEFAGGVHHALTELEEVVAEAGDFESTDIDNIFNDLFIDTQTGVFDEFSEIASYFRSIEQQGQEAVDELENWVAGARMAQLVQAIEHAPGLELDDIELGPNTPEDAINKIADEAGNFTDDTLPVSEVSVEIPSLIQDSSNDVNSWLNGLDNDQREALNTALAELPTDGSVTVSDIQGTLTTEDLEIDLAKEVEHQVEQRLKDLYAQILNEVQQYTQDKIDQLIQPKDIGEMWGGIQCRPFCRSIASPLGVPLAVGGTILGIWEIAGWFADNFPVTHNDLLDRTLYVVVAIMILAGAYSVISGSSAAGGGTAGSPGGPVGAFVGAAGGYVLSTAAFAAVLVLLINNNGRPLLTIMQDANVAI